MLTAAGAVAEEQSPTTVYRSVGEDGVVSFSDAPHPSATRVQVYPPARMDAAEQRRAGIRLEHFPARDYTRAWSHCADLIGRHEQ